MSVLWFKILSWLTMSRAVKLTASHQIEEFNTVSDNDIRCCQRLLPEQQWNFGPIGHTSGSSHQHWQRHLVRPRQQFCCGLRGCRQDWHGRRVVRIPRSLLSCSTLLTTMSLTCVDNVSNKETAGEALIKLLVLVVLVILLSLHCQQQRWHSTNNNN